jgi:hypothetical protein
MEEQIIEIIKTEVRSHQIKLDEHHVNTIALAIYKQFREHLSDKQLYSLVQAIRPEFIRIVDTLLPIVEEYELRIDELLNSNINKLVARL